MYRDRVYETSTTTGTGSFTLAGAVTGYQTFSAAFGTNQAYYLISNSGALAEWEVGSFTVSTTTLARVAGNVLSGSSGAGTLVSFTAGTKNVYNVIPASALVSMLPTAILSTVRTSVYQDVAAVNCAGIIASGNCNSNTSWTMPNGNWWSWTGVTSVARANPSGYDFVGGTTTVNTALTQVNVTVNGSYSLYQAQIGYDVYQRSVKNCNCGSFNCYSNCNCACACNCACCGGGG